MARQRGALPLHRLMRSPAPVASCQRHCSHHPLVHRPVSHRQQEKGGIADGILEVHSRLLHRSFHPIVSHRLHLLQAHHQPCQAIPAARAHTPDTEGRQHHL